MPGSERAVVIQNAKNALVKQSAPSWTRTYSADLWQALLDESGQGLGGGNRQPVSQELRYMEENAVKAIILSTLREGKNQLIF
jgi:hypothetical protein